MKVIAFTYIIDEEEVIERTLQNTLDQGMWPVVIDNGCKDRLLDIVASMGVPILHNTSPTFELNALIRYGMTYAIEQGCDWYVLKDADELMETYSGEKVPELLARANAAGCNCVNFDSYSFWATVDDDPAIPDFVDRIKHYTYFDIPYIRAVKNTPEVWLDHPHLPGGAPKLFPEHAIIRHYKFLDAEHGRKKLALRRERYDPNNIAQGSHTHYRNFTDDERYFVLEPDIYNRLNVYDGLWERKQVWDEWRESHVE
ncbi:MAG: hypothetical protein PHQ43_00945 [Dehalococcoidales bacterium]|nr:hypothetical protein [Dehalococcoidales bacterium]